MNDSVKSENAESSGIAAVPATDLTELARQGKLDPVIGRDQEIGRLVNILTRRSKNNPVLVGEAGVGKTAAVEGLAARIANGEVPERLKNKRLVSIDMTGLIAGTAMRGQFEERLNNLIDEVMRSNGDIILFIDELHLIIGAGAAGDTALDVANILKPHLARGTLQCIGATTFGEYSKHIERDPALARRFQKVVISEPTVDDTISILRGLRSRFEAFHGIKVRDSALVAAVNLTHRYVADRRLPDKAIDLVDETMARRRTEIDSTPPALRELVERIARLELELSSLTKDEDKASAGRIETIDLELQQLNQDSFKIRMLWQKSISSIHRRSELQEKLKSLEAEIDKAKRSFDFSLMTYLEQQQLAPLKKELEEDGSTDNESIAIANEIGDTEIERQLAEWTGIPLARLTENDADRLLNMETEFRSRIIGQDHATTSVANAIRISRAGISDANRPIASFLFMGPTGVGKTEVARVLADTIFGDAQAFVRLDMSEYFDRFTVSRLIGAAPGYIGYDEGGQLTEAVRRKPFACVLFDELEKAHVDVYNILLQVLDEGRLTDSRGRVVDFKNTIIIMTSNVGAEHILDEASNSETDSQSPAPEDTTNLRGGIDSLSPRTREQLHERFKPEFLNRIDDIVVFSPLRQADLEKIVELQTRLLNERLKDKGVELIVSPEARNWLANKADQPGYGARPLKRWIRQELEVPLSKFLLARRNGNEGSSNRIIVEADENGLKLKTH